MTTHYYTFHCPEHWSGDKYTPEPEMVSCQLCINKLRAIQKNKQTEEDAIEQAAIDDFIAFDNQD